MKPLKILISAFLLGSGVAMMPLATAHDGHAHHAHVAAKVQVNHAWSRPTPPGTPMGVGYMMISNQGDQAITLVAADSPRAGKVSIHETYTHEGMMRMQPVPGLEIPAGKTVELRPHSYHLMLEQLASPLQEGEQIPVRLVFDGADELAIELTVRPLDGEAADHSEMDHSAMGHH
ncbi:MAG TPA: copper chaperone PCu(A)C [Marinobacter sp.]|nr:copper chaperone PCu(A)C [Marinobacter sp.]